VAYGADVITETDIQEHLTILRSDEECDYGFIYEKQEILKRNI
jgi:hypothetical protein